MFIRTDHNQISLWILESDYGQFNDLGILQCEKEEKFNELSRKSVKFFLCIVELHDKIFMDSSNVKFAIDSTL